LVSAPGPLVLPAAWQFDFAQLVSIKGLTVPENVVVIVLQSTAGSFALSFLQAFTRITINAMEAIRLSNFFIQMFLLGIDYSFLIFFYDTTGKWVAG
jgi:hypothetical protein